MGDGVDTGANTDPELAAIRAVLGAFDEALRASRELLALCDVLQGEERRDTIAEIIDRLGHLADLSRGRW